MKKVDMQYSITLKASGNQVATLVELDNYPFKLYQVNGSTKANYHPVKLALIQTFKTCFHCGNNVIDHIMDGRGLPDNAATIDHLLPRQFRKRYQRVDKVLSCHECNHRRNVELQSPDRVGLE